MLLPYVLLVTFMQDFPLAYKKQYIFRPCKKKNNSFVSPITRHHVPFRHHHDSNQILSPRLGDQVDSGIGLSYRPANLCSQSLNS
jgi:hypothetical protein